MRDNGKNFDNCSWWERGRWNHFDDDEDIWRNINMIWILPALIMTVIPILILLARAVAVAVS